jgi:cold shock CspA family protein
LETEVQVSYQDVPVDAEIERACRREVEKLERYCGRITGCHVHVSQPHRHHQKGNLYRVRIDHVLPGSEIVVSRAPAEHASDEKPELAIREAFDAVRRRLEDEVRRVRGDVKRHSTPAHGRVSHVDAYHRCGALTTSDGRELYFHENSVRGTTLADLDVGMEVAFHEEAGEHGPQASTVRLVGRHGHRFP